LIRDGNTGRVVDCIRYDYIGPYDAPGPAKAQVTRARKTRGIMFKDGWVEQSVGWERLDGEGSVL
jgi:hypothetical protein